MFPLFRAFLRKAPRSSPITSGMQVEDGHHLRLVERERVLEPLVQVGLPAEDRAVLGHRVRNARRRLAEMAVERRAEVRGAALRAVDEGEGALEAVGRQLGAERLATVRWVDDQRLPGEVLLPVLLRVDPGGDARLLLGGGGADRLHGEAEVVRHGRRLLSGAQAGPRVVAIGSSFDYGPPRGPTLRTNGF